ncbi:MAG: iron ABC transporter permease [Flavobacteriales bacterium]|nr:iron ABC transporter permease [Flavobacteriales bacterium]
MNWKLALGFSIVLLLLLLEVFLGSVSLSAHQVVEILGDGEHPLRPLIDSRILRAFTAAIAGAALGLCGLTMQTFFRNPLAGPSVLGITSGASLGVSLLMMLSGGLGFVWQNWGIGAPLAVAGAAFLGALLILAILLISTKKLRSNTSILIFGLMMGYITSALVSVLQQQSSKDSLRSFVLWGMGDFSDTTFLQCILLAAVVLLGSLLIYWKRRDLDAWLFGADYAQSMGVNVQQVRWTLIVVVGLMAGLVTAFCGPIAFLGLSVPHLVRGVFKGGKHQHLIFKTLLFGAALAMLCDLIARLPGWDVSLPLNAVTSALGAPVVIWIILKGRRVF